MGANQTPLRRNMDERQLVRHAEAVNFDYARMPAALDAIDSNARNTLRSRIAKRWQRSGVGLAGHGRFVRTRYNRPHGLESKAPPFPAS
jgi:hypothetical protein